MAIVLSRKLIKSATGPWLVCLVLQALTGCGNDRPLVPVSGRVTYGGGEWPMPGNISFSPSPLADGSRMRPGSASFDKDGKFVVGSFQPGDGLLPGTYRVKVSCVDPLDFSKTPRELDLVAPDFRIDDLVVEAGMDPIELNIDVPKKE